MRGSSLIVLTFGFSFLLQSKSDSSHIPNKNCVFYYDSKTFDLESAVAAVPDGILKVNGTKGHLDYFCYLYKPCQEFIPQDVPQKSADVPHLAWQLNHETNVTQVFPIGREPRMHWDQARGYSLEMIGKDAEETVRTMEVQLKCDKKVTKPTFVMTGEQPDLQYNFVLTHKCVCPDGCVRMNAGLTGLTTGSILCIVFFVGLFVYFLGGVAYRWKFREAQGLDRIPNKEFWASYPGLVKDGFVFIVTTVKEARGAYGYNVV